MKLGIIGIGNIGTALLEHAHDRVETIYVYDKKDLNIKSKKVVIKESLEEVFASSEVVVEAAHPDVVRRCLELALKYKRDLMIMSTGGLLGNEILIEEMKEKGIKLIIPSGAIAGMDAIRAARIGKINRITLTTTKGPKSLGLDLKEKKIIFSGSVGEAVSRYPMNINVAATLLLNSGFKNVKVEIIADPAIKTNTHKITVEGDFGKITARTDNVPSPENPKTSYLAILSAVSALDELLQTFL